MRRLPSWTSETTKSRLISQLRLAVSSARASSRTNWAGVMPCRTKASSKAPKKAASARQACLTVSPSPSRMCRSERVSQRSRSTNTALG